MALSLVFLHHGSRIFTALPSNLGCKIDAVQSDSLRGLIRFNLYCFNSKTHRKSYKNFPWKSRKKTKLRVFIVSRHSWPHSIRTTFELRHSPQWENCEDITAEPEVLPKHPKQKANHCDAAVYPVCFFLVGSRSFLSLFIAAIGNSCSTLC